jgi:hypothetical protein
MTEVNAQAHSVTQLSNNEISPRKLWWVIPLATAAATTANVIFYFFVTRILGEPLAFPEQYPPPETSPLPVGDVVLFSVIFSLGAGVVFALVSGFSRRPVRTFVIISTVVLILSCIPPLMAPSPLVTQGARLTLVSMHIIGAIVVVGTLIGLSKSD